VFFRASCCIVISADTDLQIIRTMGNQMNVPVGAYDMNMNMPPDLLDRMPPTPKPRVPAPVVAAASTGSTPVDEHALAEAQMAAEAAAVRAKYQEVWAAFQSLDWKAEDDVLRSDLAYSKMSPLVWMKERKHASAIAQQRMQSTLAEAASVSDVRASDSAEPSAPQPISLALVLGLIKHFKKNRLLSPMMVVRILMQARYDRLVGMHGGGM
jgi:hypothetical protein